MANYFSSTNGTFCVDCNGRISTDKTGNITATYPKVPETNGGRPFILKEGKVRRLTPIEVERLQTVPDDYTKAISDSQRYKVLGNGWTVDVISHIFKFLQAELWS